jgi:hypothetical protein
VGSFWIRKDKKTLVNFACKIHAQVRSTFPNFPCACFWKENRRLLLPHVSTEYITHNLAHPGKELAYHSRAPESTGTVAANMLPSQTIL